MPRPCFFAAAKPGAVNVDDAYAKRIMEQADCRLLTYSAQGNPASLMAEHVELFSDRVEFDAVYQNKRASVTLGFPAFSASITRSVSSPLRWR